MVEFQHAAELVQRHDLVAQASGPFTAGKPVDEGQPLAHRGTGLALVLQRAAEIDVGGVELRIDPQRIAQRIDGGEGIAAALGHHRHVEMGRREMRIIRIEGDPALVEFCGRCRTLRLLGMSAS